MKAASTHSLPTLPCACASLRRASRAVSQLYDRELRPAGLNTAQFTLLQALARTGRITQGQLGRMLALDSTTLSRTLRPLQSRGWIRCDPGQDRRERHMELIGAGRTRLDKATPAWERAQRRLQSRLASAEWDALLHGLADLAGVARHA